MPPRRPIRNIARPAHHAWSGSVEERHLSYDLNGNLIDSEVDDYEYGLPTITDPNTIVNGRPLLLASSAVGNPFLFTGQMYDPETRLYHYRTRPYEPRMGRFISVDSIGVWGDEANLGNGYAYVSNRPGEYVDPWGLEGIWSHPGQGNCYRWACDDPAKHGEFPKVNPGNSRPGAFPPLSPQVPPSCDDLMNRAKCDGLNPPNDDGSCPPGQRKVSLAISPMMIDVDVRKGTSHPWWDFHWWREEPDGTWTHKPGLTPVKDTDYSGRPIQNPEDSDRGIYSNFCGYLCVPPGTDLDR